MRLLVEEQTKNKASTTATGKQRIETNSSKLEEEETEK